MQLHKHLTKLAHLGHTIGHNAVLRLSARMGDDVLMLLGPGDDVLMLLGPGDEVVAQEHHVSRSGLTSVRTTGLVSISVDDEVRRRGPVKKQTVVEGDLGLSVDQSEAGLAVSQANTLKDVPSVLALVKKEVISPLLY
jgi:hypothetical protein